MTTCELHRKLDSMIADFHNDSLHLVNDNCDHPVTMSDFNAFIDRTAHVLSDLEKSVIEYLENN